VLLGPASVMAQSSPGSTVGKSAHIPPVVAAAGEREAVPIESGTIRFLFTGKETNGTVAVVEVVEREYATSLHRHNNTDEAFYVLEGTLTVWVAGKLHQLGPGLVFVHSARHAAFTGKHH
jgi:quercetin dioxygenase-like cupin family protein